jgi:hypothetical protein
VYLLLQWKSNRYYMFECIVCMCVCVSIALFIQYGMRHIVKAAPL